MIDSETIGVKRCRIGKASVELGNPRRQIIRPVRNWERIQIGLHRGNCDASGVEVGDESLCSLWQPKAKPLVGEEEERLVFEYGATEGAAEIILPLLRFRKRATRPWRTTEPIEPIIRIQDVIAQIIEQRAMKAVRPRARDNRDLSTGLPAEFRRIRGSLDAEFLQSIYGDQTVCPP